MSKNFAKSFQKNVTPRKMKICIGIPCTGTVRIETVLSLIGILQKTPHEVFVAYRTGCYIEQNRTELIKTAIKENCEKIFFLDSDIIVEPDVINKLIALDKPVIGAAYNNRSFEKQGDKMLLYSNVKIADEEGNLSAVRELPKEPFKCVGVPTGAMLVNIETVKKLPQPWFDLEYFEDGSLKTGEDIYFCYLCRDNGVEVWCDPTIQIGHIGTFTY